MCRGLKGCCCTEILEIKSQHSKVYIEFLLSFERKILPKYLQKWYMVGILTF